MKEISQEEDKRIRIPVCVRERIRIDRYSCTGRGEGFESDFFIIFDEHIKFDPSQVTLPDL